MNDKPLPEAGAKMIAELRLFAYDDSGHKEVPTHVCNHAADLIERLLATPLSGPDEGARKAAERVAARIEAPKTLSPEMQAACVRIILQEFGPLLALPTGRNEALEELREDLLPGIIEREAADHVRECFTENGGPFKGRVAASDAKMLLYYMDRVSRALRARKAQEGQ